MEQETNDLIKSEIENNDVCLFMKGTPDAPQCGFSMATSNILKVLEVNFKGVNVLACLLYTSPSPRDRTTSRMPSSA